MTTSHGEMRETCPVEGEAYRFRLEQTDGRLRFDLEGDGMDGPALVTSLSVESTGPGRDCAAPTRERLMPSPGPGSDRRHLWLDGELYVFQRAETRRGNTAGSDGPAEVLAPMPGAVLEVLVGEGEPVERNQTVVVMESMKMVMVITAPRGGVVGPVAVQPGQQVERGMRILELSPEGGTGE